MCVFETDAYLIPRSRIVQDGALLWWACPEIFLTVYDKSTFGEEALSVAMVPLRLLNTRRATGGIDTSGQLRKGYPLKWYPMRAFEFLDARKNRDPDGGGGSILASFSLEGPTDSVHAVLSQKEDRARTPPPPSSPNTPLERIRVPHSERALLPL